MKRPASILILISIVALILGWGIGSFFTERSVAKLVASIPASPIVVDAHYNREKHMITYSILNPGGTPLTIVDESFVFTPGKNSQQKAYIVSHVPIHQVLPPGVITQVKLKLKAGTEKLQIGDAVLATFTYVHPLSPDIYTVTTPFKLGMNGKNVAKKHKVSSIKGGK